MDPPDPDPDPQHCSPHYQEMILGRDLRINVVLENKLFVPLP
jgi:hypothetical protein